MKFLVDAQFPQRLARWLQAEGHEAVHTRDLPEGNRTGAVPERGGVKGPVGFILRAFFSRASTS